MQLPYPSADFLEISYQPHTDILVGRWLRPVTEAEARQGYDDLLADAQVHHARYWLLDIRRRHRSAPATLAWLLGTYYSQLVRTLGPPVCMVYFMAPGLREEFMQDGAVPEPHTYDGQPFRMNQTITETDAVAWLQAEQQIG
ncbi:hypothetical protein [Hymenobacter nivis]|uniref:STAS/SEC14 domain-containing protein n=1 Tax=Hymenobacter nivis TaxID=1850093 RepID=A0A502GZR4_9BACT|nr:hypothetical protein [Hymenobacter nivis]TPG67591.1 hypothetical protein EAH73_07770 [Hymenobacter nivis]